MSFFINLIPFFFLCSLVLPSIKTIPVWSSTNKYRGELLSSSDSETPKVYHPEVLPSLHPRVYFSPSLHSLVHEDKATFVPICNPAFFKDPDEEISNHYGADANLFNLNRLNDSTPLLRKKYKNHVLGDYSTEVRILAYLTPLAVFPELICAEPQDYSFIMTTVPGVTLYDAIPKLFSNLSNTPWDTQFAEVAVAMIDALKVLHSAGIVHLDLHLKNWIVSRKANEPPQFHIIDFSRAKFLEEIHTPAISEAPEVKDSPLLYSEVSDVWYLGHAFDTLYRQSKSAQPSSGVAANLVTRWALFSEIAENTIKKMQSLVAVDRPFLTDVEKVFVRLLTLSHS